MDILLLKVQPEKKDFLMTLLEELSFVTVEDNYSEEEEKLYTEAILESEENIEKGEVLTQSELEKNIQTWRTSTK